MFEPQFARARALILQPAQTWDAIDAEPFDLGERYKSWILPLAAIPAVASFIGDGLIGRSIAGIGYRLPLGAALSASLVGFALSLGFVYVFARILEALAPSFRAEKDFNQALKLAAYFPVAYWAAGVFALLPPLEVLWLIGGLYSLYLLFVGLPKLLRPAADKAGGFALAALAVAVVLGLIGEAIVSAVAGPVPYGLALGR